jgi:hypothetical protein
MPVLMIGVMLVSSTLRASMPAGVPVKFIAGNVKPLLRPSVMCVISRVFAIASCGVPPTNCTIAGAVAIANPPSPAVSVIELSPMSGAACSGPYPGKYRPFTSGAVASNQRSPVPDNRMPKRTPLRDIAVTRLLFATPCAASSMTLHAAIDRFRKK